MRLRKTALNPPERLHRRRKTYFKHKLLFNLMIFCRTLTFSEYKIQYGQKQSNRSHGCMLCMRVRIKLLQ